MGRPKGSINKRVDESEKEILNETITEHPQEVAKPKVEPEQKLKTGVGLKEEIVTEKEYTAHIVKNYDGSVDVFYLNKKDENFEYRFLKWDPENLSLKTSNALLDGGGWQICSTEHLTRIGFKKSELSPDGFCRRGSNVLAFMPKSLFAEKLAEKNRRANAPVDAISRLLKKGDSREGGKELHKSMRGIQTAKDLGMGGSSDD